MAVQDLTPQLRTRLSHVERAVGWFIILATILFLAGFSYYVYHTAERKGWFKTKVPYHTYLADAVGLRVGDKVKLMGFDVGEITLIEGMPAGKDWFNDNHYNVFIEFVVYEPYYGYVWTDSHVRAGTGDFLGGRTLEISKGSTGEVTVIIGKPLRVLNNATWKTNGLDYVELPKQPKGFWLHADESPALTTRLDDIANQVQAAIPGILNLTNQLYAVLNNGTRLTENLSDTVAQIRPIMSNLLVMTSMLTNGQGSLGDWLIPTNLNAQLTGTLATANKTLGTANTTLATSETNIAVLAASLNKTLENLANITGNLNQQVQTNDQIVSQISSLIVQSDQFIQGLKHHWLLRSAFKEKATNAEPARSSSRPPPPRAGKNRE